MPLHREHHPALRVAVAGLTISLSAASVGEAGLSVTAQQQSAAVAATRSVQLGQQRPQFAHSIFTVPLRSYFRPASVTVHGHVSNMQVVASFKVKWLTDIAIKHLGPARRYVTGARRPSPDETDSARTRGVNSPYQRPRTIDSGHRHRSQDSAAHL